MKPLLKINFTDFWSGFTKEDNYFVRLLSKAYHVVIADHPDILIYSCYGEAYLQYKCIRIFFSGENIRPDFTGCDYAISFDLTNHPRHYRLPLYYLYIDILGQMDNLLKPRTPEEIKSDWLLKKKFCCMLVSNPNAKKRIDFFHKLSKVKQVDSGGRHLNNVGGPVANKIDFIKEYKFVFAFENSSHPGYITEKIIEPFFVHSIPIYWGNPYADMDFNPRRFINYHDFPNETALIERIMEIDQNDELAIQMLSEPVFLNNQAPDYTKDENVLTFFRTIIQQQGHIVPVAQTNKKILHSIKKRYQKVGGKISYHLGLNFR